MVFENAVAQRVVERHIANQQAEVGVVQNGPRAKIRNAAQVTGVFNHLLFDRALDAVVAKILQTTVMEDS
jgi:PleD family two-component response regulator